MDMVLLKTFLEVVANNSFAGAAEKLFVSQSAVSLRVKALEEHLGRTVFLRSKTGITLTPAGHQLVRYAQSLLQTWEEARQQVAVPEQFSDVLVVAGEYGLWNRLLLRWLPRVADALPDIAFRAEVARHDRIIRQMVEGTVDMGVMYKPQLRPGLEVEALFDDNLVLVATNELAQASDPDYIYIDWGEEFTVFHTNHFPDNPHPRMTFSLGQVTLNYLLNNGGSAYMPKRLVQPFVDVGKLQIIHDMPVFQNTVHVVWRNHTKAELVEQSLDSLREVVQQTINDELPPPFWVTP